MFEMKESGDFRQKSVHVNGFSVDLVPAFVSRKGSGMKLDEEEDDDVELSLGLSMNGRFGLDPRRENKLSRSSSIPEFMTAVGNKIVDLKSSLPSVHAPLSRACSLPTESDEWRKRKEIQSLRRLEAKRKRLEKMKNPRSGRDPEENGHVHGRKGRGEFSVPFGLPRSNCGDNVVVGTLIKVEKPPLFRQGSIGSQGSGSSGISESECRLPPQESRIGQVKEEEEEKMGGLTMGSNEAKEMLKNVLLKMPYVSTTGEGEEGKRIEGFLYRFKKGEEARIVCVCHGNFLSPAEFVKHAGGGDVSHPLRHIIVNPSPLV